VKLLVYILLAYHICLLAQNPCKKITISVCIDGESKLHIKNGNLFWEHIKDYAPGTHFQCGSMGITKVNGTNWSDWKSPFKLNFNTNGLTVQATVIYKNEISKMVQKPSASNNWETIWHFSDPSGSSHNYAVSFTFCPSEQDTKLKADASKKDSTIVAQPENKRKDQAPKENIICNLYFETGKTVLTKQSEEEVKKLISLLKNVSTPIEISSYKTELSLKLYEERSFFINSLLIKNGIDQNRIKYIVFDNEKNNVVVKVIKCIIIIN